MTNSPHDGGSSNPKFLTIKATASALGVPIYQVQRAVRAGLLPTYRLYSGRVLLKWDEVIAFIESTRRGGDQ